MPQREPGDSNHRDSQEGSQSEGATILYHQSPQTSLPSQTATRSPMPPVNSPRTSELGPSLLPYLQHYSIRKWQRGASGEPPRTVYTVPHCCIGDDHPSLQLNPKVPNQHSYIYDGIVHTYDYLCSKPATLNPNGARNAISKHFAELNRQLALHREDDIRRGTLPSEAEVIELRLADGQEDKDLPDKVHQMSLMEDESSSACGPPKMEDQLRNLLQKSVTEIITNRPQFRSISPEVRDPSWAGSVVVDDWNNLRARHLRQLSLEQEQHFMLE
jgi:hypothetical protein